jgi:hypothetical protein
MHVMTNGMRVTAAGLCAALLGVSSGCATSSNASGAASNGAPSPASSSAAASAPFTLAEGLEHDVCGIGIVVKFIPATASSSKADFAVVYGGPVNKVEDKVQDHIGTDPLPDNAAHAVAGSTITVYGKQFTVNAVDTAGTSVQLQPQC